MRGSNAIVWSWQLSASYAATFPPVHTRKTRGHGLIHTSVPLMVAITAKEKSLESGILIQWQKGVHPAFLVGGQKEHV